MDYIILINDEKETFSFNEDVTVIPLSKERSKNYNVIMVDGEPHTRISIIIVKTANGEPFIIDGRSYKRICNINNLQKLVTCDN